MSFKQRKAERHPERMKYISMDGIDWKKIERIAKDVGESSSEITRQCIRYALENLTKLNLKSSTSSRG